MISKDLLRRIRNDLPMPVAIAALGVLYPALIAFLAESCRSVIRSANFCYTENSANRGPWN
jgi:hypothetical protein